MGDAGEDAGGRHSTSTAELKAIARRCKEAGCGLHCWFGRGELCVCDLSPKQLQGLELFETTI